MKMIDLLIIIGISSLIFNLTGLAMDLFGGSKRKKTDKHEDSVTSGYISEYGGFGIVGTGTMNNQIVYKVDGDFNGNIKGNNVTVILMGNGNINGNIESQDGNVVLIKGSINGDVKADKVVCPTKPTTEDKDQYICKSCYHYVQTPTGSYCTEGSASYGVPQGASPQKRTDYYTSIGNHVSIYDSFPVAHIKCQHCKKYFATQVKVHTSVVDGDVVETSVEEIKPDY